MPTQYLTTGHPQAIPLAYNAEPPPHGRNDSHVLGLVLGNLYPGPACSFNTLVAYPLEWYSCRQEAELFLDVQALCPSQVCGWVGCNMTVQGYLTWSSGWSCLCGQDLYGVTWDQVTPDPT